MLIYIVPLCGLSHHKGAQVLHALSRYVALSQMHTDMFIHEGYEPYLALPSQPKLVQLVLIYQPPRDGEQSWPRTPIRYYNQPCVVTATIKESVL